MTMCNIPLDNRTLFLLMLRAEPEKTVRAVVAVVAMRVSRLLYVVIGQCQCGSRLVQLGIIGRIVGFQQLHRL